MDQMNLASTLILWLTRMNQVFVNFGVTRVTGVKNIYREKEKEKEY